VNLWEVDPFDARPLLRAERAEMLAFLDSLTDEDWALGTAAGEWTVKHVALHLLDGDLHRLAIGRDHDLTGLLPADTADILAAGLHAKNQRWVEAANFLSGRLVIELLALTTDDVAEWTSHADPAAPSRISWASDDPLPAWFDLAREFTETWVHHQQMRHALRMPTDPSRLDFVLQTFVWAFPHQYRAAAPAGTQVGISIDPYTWFLACEGDGSWTLNEGSATAAAASLRSTPEQAWRMLVGAEIDRAGFVLDGPEELTGPLLQVRGVIA
jgi:uncharacterized protein (TIGR03083 family)